MIFSYAKGYSITQFGIAFVIEDYIDAPFLEYGHGSLKITRAAVSYDFISPVL